MNQVEKDNFLEIFKYLPIEKPVLIVLNIYQFFMKMFPRFLSFIFKLGIFWGIFSFLIFDNKKFLNMTITITSGFGFVLMRYVVKKQSEMFVYAIGGSI
ncbi:MAG TPA: hypothetical protein PKL50_00205 [bacterium]|jgi:hypothetical protein|nr:hypothetical protein [bacterium]HQI03015.1 hypothetical protein [bacterium]